MLVVLLAVSVNLLIDLFADVVRKLGGGLGHADHIHFVRITLDLVALLFLLVEVLQVLLGPAELSRVPEHRLLLVFVKSKVLKPGCGLLGLPAETGKVF